MSIYPSWLQRMTCSLDYMLYTLPQSPRFLPFSFAPYTTSNLLIHAEHVCKYVHPFFYLLIRTLPPSDNSYSNTFLFFSVFLVSPLTTYLWLNYYSNTSPTPPLPISPPNDPLFSSLTVPSMCFPVPLDRNDFLSFRLFIVSFPSLTYITLMNYSRFTPNDDV